MKKEKWCDHFQGLLDTLEDNYIKANLKYALDRYRNGQPLPIRKPFMLAPEGYCIHNIKLNDTCDKCIESYGENRITHL